MASTRFQIVSEMEKQTQERQTKDSTSINQSDQTDGKRQPFLGSSMTDDHCDSPKYHFCHTHCVACESMKRKNLPPSFRTREVLFTIFHHAFPLKTRFYGASITNSISNVNTPNGSTGAAYASAQTLPLISCRSTAHLRARSPRNFTS
jgi:hypothetical protein